ncbi:MAG TPA: hypothetical protein VFP92_12150 [Rhodanobacteraceae bacterium]|nr:hypothetical protein [Rhodanobacteraceae bacterium]
MSTPLIGAVLAGAGVVAADAAPAGAELVGADCCEHAPSARATAAAGARYERGM